MAVTPLTDDQIYTLRFELADNNETAILSATIIEKLWQRAAGDWNTLYALSLRAITAFYARKVTAEGQDQREYNDSLYKHYKALYDDAAIVAALNIPTVGLSRLSLNQNYPVDSDAVTDLDYEWEV
jgi:hypothetical protein